MTEKKKKTWGERFKLTLSKEDTFEEVWQLRLTKAGFFATLATFILFIVVIVSLLIAFTNLRELIPGYPDVQIRRDIVRNAILLDSLEHEIKLRDLYFENMKKIVSGEAPDNITYDTGSTINPQDVAFTRSLEDSLLRQQVESEEEYNLSVSMALAHRSINFYNIHFFPPVQGIISNRFDPARDHFGTDIAGVPGEVVHATLDGTVIFSAWTLETGYVVEIQHADNLVSVYKHNSRILKPVGAIVKAGEDIALMGTTGELYTTGPHLHFELWYQGQPLDPEKYVVF